MAHTSASDKFASNSGHTTARLVWSQTAESLETEQNFTDVCDACDEAFNEILDHLEYDKPYHLDRKSEYSTHDVEYHETLAAFKKSARGCQLCDFFLRQAKGTEGSRRALYSIGNPFELDKHFRLDFWIKNVETHKGKKRKISDFKLKFNSSSLAEGVWFEASVYPTDTAVPFVNRAIPASPPLHQIRKWIQECKETHGPVCADRGETELPSRLIDCNAVVPRHIEESFNDQGTNNPNVPELRLIMFSELKQREANGQDVRYAALSHCWGGCIPESRLRKENKSAYERWLPFVVLEKTFQDAVIATLELGFRYLWIDTHCIVQDDPEDWRLECSRMAAVYTNAAVTIAAASTPNAYSGLLNNRPAPDDPSCHIWLRKKWLVRIQTAPDGFSAFRNRPDYESLLNNRAWALQERLLSPRILHFGKYQMALECNSKMRFENDHPFDRTLVRLESNTLPWLTSQPDNERFNTKDDDVVTPFYKVIETYTACKLSKIDDVLPAFSGIARKYHNWTGDEYLAGLWRKELIEGLCWERGGRDILPIPFLGSSDQDLHAKVCEDETQQPTYYIPSWSWASLNHPISVRSGSQDNIVRSAEILSARVNLVGPDPFGQVNGGEIILKSWTREYTFGLTKYLPSLISVIWSIFPWVDFVPDRDFVRLGEKFTFVLIQETAYDAARGRGAVEMWEHWGALALEPVSEEEQKRQEMVDGVQVPTFRRVGYAIAISKTIGWIKGGEYRKIRIV